MNWFIRNRSFTNTANRFVDAVTPPFIRDSRWFCWLLYYAFFKDKTSLYFNFRRDMHKLSKEEYKQYYHDTADLVTRPTDLNQKCFNKLIQDIQNTQVLEVGCGRGALALELKKKNSVTVCDIIIADDLKKEEKITCFETEIESLPFPDKSFKTTVCTHTLEHVLRFEKCLAELRRVTQEKIYIVVPLQRPYRCTPDLHVNYFPYPESFLVRALPKTGAYTYDVFDGDLYYVETQI